MERPKLEVADVFRRYGPAYRQQHAGSLSRGQRRVMSAIELCRTAALGGHLEQCDSCGHPPMTAAAIAIVPSASRWPARSGSKTAKPNCCPRGGLSPDGQRWIACRPGFFLPVRVLSGLFRRLFLESLQQTFDQGKLHFFSSQERLREPRAFA